MRNRHHILLRRRPAAGAPGPLRSWTVAEAKAKLSEILRLAETEGPQRIGVRKRFVVVPASAWDGETEPRKPLGRWLIENVPRGTDLDAPDRAWAARRAIPFIGDEHE